MKSNLSYFVLDGGAKGSKRAKGKGKSGKSGKSGKKRARGSGKGKRGFDQSPNNEDPNFERYKRGLNEGRGEFVSKEEWKEYQEELSRHRNSLINWGNNDTENGNGRNRNRNNGKNY